MSPERKAPIRYGVRHTTFLSDYYDRATRIDESQFPYRRGIGLKRSSPTQIWQNERWSVEPLHRVYLYSNHILHFLFPTKIVEVLRIFLKCFHD